MNTEDRLVFHSGTKADADGSYLTNGGRVLINVAIEDTLAIAAKKATDGARQIKFSGSQFRTDIAKKALRPTW